MKYYYVILFILSILPSSIILKIIYDRDDNKESKALLIILFGLGIMSCLLTTILDIFLDVVSTNYHNLINNYSENILKTFAYAFFSIALIEEFSKWILNFIVIWRHKEFDEKYDSIVYSCFSSLGFATFENCLYVISNGMKIAFLRGIFSVPAHAMFGIISGYYIGNARDYFIKNNKPKCRLSIIISLAFPIILHTIYDFLILLHNNISIILFIPFMILLYINAIDKVTKSSKKIIR
ncbi:MAG: PrsW family glutamic-type intramembrane protease [bacterium]|nr:PrsW family glutamic-type intramembrane protease [bacterium]